MVSRFWQVASVIVFAVYGVSVTVGDRLCGEDEQFCFLDSGRDDLRENRFFGASSSRIERRESSRTGIGEKGIARLTPEERSERENRRSETRNQNFKNFENRFIGNSVEQRSQEDIHNRRSRDLSSINKERDSTYVTRDYIRDERVLEPHSRDFRRQNSRRNSEATINNREELAPRQERRSEIFQNRRIIDDRSNPRRLTRTQRSLRQNSLSDTDNFRGRLVRNDRVRLDEEKFSTDFDDIRNIDERRLDGIDSRRDLNRSFNSRREMVRKYDSRQQGYLSESEYEKLGRADTRLVRERFSADSDDIRNVAERRFVRLHRYRDLNGSFNTRRETVRNDDVRRQKHISNSENERLERRNLDRERIISDDIRNIGERKVDRVDRRRDLSGSFNTRRETVRNVEVRREEHISDSENERLERRNFDRERIISDDIRNIGERKVDRVDRRRDLSGSFNTRREMVRNYDVHRERHTRDTEDENSRRTDTPKTNVVLNNRIRLDREKFSADSDVTRNVGERRFNEADRRRIMYGSFNTRREMGINYDARRQGHVSESGESLDRADTLRDRLVSNDRVRVDIERLSTDSDDIRNSGERKVDRVDRRRDLSGSFNTRREMVRNYDLRQERHTRDTEDENSRRTDTPKTNVVLNNRVRLDREKFSADSDVTRNVGERRFNEAVRRRVMYGSFNTRREMGINYDARRQGHVSESAESLDRADKLRDRWVSNDRVRVDLERLSTDSDDIRNSGERKVDRVDRRRDLSGSFNTRREMVRNYDLRQERHTRDTEDENSRRIDTPKTNVVLNNRVRLAREKFSADSDVTRNVGERRFNEADRRRIMYGSFNTRREIGINYNARRQGHVSESGESLDRADTLRDRLVANDRVRVDIERLSTDSDDIRNSGERKVDRVDNYEVRRQEHISDSEDESLGRRNLDRERIVRNIIDSTSNLDVIKESSERRENLYNKRERSDSKLDRLDSRRESLGNQRDRLDSRLERTKNRQEIERESARSLRNREQDRLRERLVTIRDDDTSDRRFSQQIARQRRNDEWRITNIRDVSDLVSDRSDENRNLIRNTHRDRLHDTRSDRSEPESRIKSNRRERTRFSQDIIRNQKPQENRRYREDQRSRFVSEVPVSKVPSSYVPESIRNILSDELPMKNTIPTIQLLQTILIAVLVLKAITQHETLNKKFRLSFPDSMKNLNPAKVF